ncbi:dipeptidase [Desulfofalx alkaliphila]|uniref:dipeptidase n=1 Tax=Desulfofalx alkaliphila TaxID=105483 RepID=UPI00054D661F|nr:dipeptidase [Desulfofalx alkaliphila]
MDYLSLHKKLLVVDAHCDTLTVLQPQNRKLGEYSTKGQVDLQRLAKGGVNVQFFAIFISPDYGEGRGIERALELIDFFYKECENSYNPIKLATNRNDIIGAVEDGKIAAVLAIEGGEALGGKLHMLSIYHRLGVRCLTLTWNGRNSIADGVGERRTNGGLTKFGVQVIKEMNRLGMLIDVSHLSEAGFWDVIKVTEQPVVATHSNCYALCKHPRNLTDEQIKAIAKGNGVVGLTLVPDFIDGEGQANLEKFLDHFDHIADLVGVDYIGLGSDFDGVDTTIIEVRCCADLPNITSGLLKRGYKESDIGKILGGNFMRVFDEVTKVSQPKRRRC